MCILTGGENFPGDPHFLGAIYSNSLCFRMMDFILM